MLYLCLWGVETAPSTTPEWWRELLLARSNRSKIPKFLSKVGTAIKRTLQAFGITRTAISVKAGADWERANVREQLREARAKYEKLRAKLREELETLRAKLREKVG